MRARAAPTVAAGAAAGAAVLYDYTAATAVAILGLWLLLRRAWASLGWFAAGGAPFVLLLGIYDRLAFGSPFHLSYRYVSNRYTAEQAKGLFGIGWPRVHGVEQTFVGSRGLLVFSPLAVIAFAGLVAAARRSGSARVALAVVGASALISFGYFDPYGGQSPGPRYMVLGLPFLILGLAYAWGYRTRGLRHSSLSCRSGCAPSRTAAWDTTAKAFDLAYVPYTLWRRAGLPSVGGLALVWVGWLLTLGLALLLTFGPRRGADRPAQVSSAT